MHTYSCCTRFCKSASVIEESDRNESGIYRVLMRLWIVHLDTPIIFVIAEKKNNINATALTVL